MLQYSSVYLYDKRCIGDPMATGKTSTPTFRIEPALKEGLRAASAQGHRSIANMIAVMIRDYCGRNGITSQVQEALPQANTRRPRGKTR